MKFLPIKVMDPDGKMHRIFSTYRGTPKLAVWIWTDRKEWFLMKFTSSINVAGKEQIRLSNKGWSTRITEIQGN
jgi:hypothetical protein